MVLDKLLFQHRERVDFLLFIFSVAEEEVEVVVASVQSLFLEEAQVYRVQVAEAVFVYDFQW